MKTTKPERLLTNAEAAELLGLTPRSLEQLRNRGRGPVYTYVGRFPRYSRKHLNEYLASRGRIPTNAR